MILFLSLNSEEKTIFQEQNGGIIIIANDQRISAGISAESNISLFRNGTSKLAK